MSDSQPIACNLTAIEHDQREQHKENANALFQSVEEWQELSDGYAFRIPTETAVIEKAGAFVARERQCCPFFMFTFEVTPENGPVWLKLTGNKQIKDYIKQNVILQLGLSEG